MTLPAKIDQLRTITNSDLNDYFLTTMVDGGTVEDIPLRYRFLFCGGWWINEEGISERCLNVVEFKNLEWGAPNKPWRYNFVCKNCNVQKWLKRAAALNQQKWTEGPDKYFSISHYDIEKYGNEETSGVLMVKVPAEEIVRIVEIVDGPTLYHAEVPIWGDRKVIFYLRGLIPDKTIKELIKKYDAEQRKK